MTRTIGRWSLALGLAAAAGGCQGKDEAKPGRPAARVAIDAAPIDAAVARARVPCPPDQDAIRAAAQKIFALKGELGEAQCTALLVEGVARWLLELGYSDDAGEHFYAGLIDATTGLASWSESHDAPEGVSLDRQQAVDLDGDGADELLTTDWGGSHGMAWGLLKVRSVKDGRPYSIAELPLGYTNEGAVAIGIEKKPTRCESTVEVIDGPPGAKPTKQIAITGARRVGAPAETDCPPTGRHVHAYDGRGLAAVEP